MFVDKAKIFVRAGKGGNGAVAFRREIYVPAGGPSGGDGGDGGSIIVRADRSLRTLMDFKYKTKYTAQHGEDGKNKNKHGANGEDLILKVPQGTIIRDAQSNLVIVDLNEDGQEFVLVRGGIGGKGNARFKSSIRQAPRFAKPGREGQERDIILELKMMADVGLLGFPNVGKSTFLSIVSKAKPKIANYHFTTLKPNLGVVKLDTNDSFVIADIPGLIEGAHEGVGLGHDFLRHVERTKVLIHIVDISGIEGRDPFEDFMKINNELQKYNQKLSKRPQIVVANKMDILFEEGKYEEFKAKVEELGYKVFKMSAATKDGVDQVIREASKLLKEVEDFELFEEDEMIKEYDFEDNDGDEIIVKIENGVYIVEGKELERILYSVDFEYMESLRFFQTIMEKKGVFKKLRELGANDGDLVKIYDLEFEYYE